MQTFESFLDSLSADAAKMMVYDRGELKPLTEAGVKHQVAYLKTKAREWKEQGGGD